MKQSAFHILRVGTAITFIWIGVLILKDTVSFSALISPWALEFLGRFTPDVDQFLHTMMIETAVLDIAVGFFLLIDKFVFLAALLGFFHLLGVVITTDILVTVRDIGLMASALALMVHVVPQPFVKPSDFKGWLKLILS